MMTAKLTKEACRAARALLGLTTQAFALKLDVSPTTINGIEAGNPIRESTERRIVERLDELGVEITNGDGTGARLRFASAWADDEASGSAKA
jgi:DNA-binding XRE family transcriptional regulator